MLCEPCIVIAISNLFVAALVAALAVPLARGRIGRNHLYGVRNRHSLSSDAAWRRINVRGGKLLLIWSVPVAVVGLVGLFGRLPPNRGLEIALACAPLLYLIPCVMIGRRSRVLAAEVNDRAEEAPR